MFNKIDKMWKAPKWFKDIPAQWAKIRRGLDIFRISSKSDVYRLVKSKKIWPFRFYAIKF